MWTLACPKPQDTRALGAVLGKLQKPCVVVLTGALGAGKTCFAQGVGQGLGVSDPVVSPTFALMVEYETPGLPLLHIDVYRLAQHDLEGAGIEEAIDEWPGVVLVEWGDRFPEIVRDDHLVVALTRPEVRVSARGTHAGALLDQWRKHHG